MTLLELPDDEVRSHRGTAVEPADLQEFWRRTLERARRTDTAPALVPAPSPLRLLESFDVTFPGFDGQPVRGWLHLPRGTSGTLPCVVQYVGYGGGRGLVHEKTFWASAGYAHFVMDTRGQGSAGSVGETADPHDGAPEYPGVLTRGILDPETYYYRRVYTDAVRAVDAVRQHPRVDPSRVAVAGASQGGAITLAVAALADGLVAAMPDVPFLCDIRRACALSDELPYLELVRYLRIHRDQVERVFATLGYIDAAVLAPLADAPALFSVAMLDTVCPPSTVYSAYNAYGGSKQIREYAYNDHEGGGPFHEIVQAEWLAGILAG